VYTPARRASATPRRGFAVRVSPGFPLQNPQVCYTDSSVILGKTKQEVVSQFRCAGILAAARKVFGRKGFASATVDEIAEAAGVAKGTVYLYFKSKREIYLAALRLGWAGAVEEIRHSVEAAPGARAKLRAFIGARVHYADQNRDFISIFHAEFANLRISGANKHFKSLYLEQVQIIRSVLEEAAAHGEIRLMRADAAAFAIYETTRGLITQRLLGWSKASAEEDIDFLFNFIWSGMAGLASSAGERDGSETE
jgi:AcrR family transcriptional regulator